MISRPLDLSSRLRPLPRNNDVFFYINIGAIVLFFIFFGSRFVLSPGLGVDFKTPEMTDPLSLAKTTNVVVALKGVDLAIVEGRILDFDRLALYLKDLRKTLPDDARLLIQAGGNIPASSMIQLHDMAENAGFRGIIFAANTRSVPEKNH